jgi:hypothetical protein
MRDLSERQRDRESESQREMTGKRREEVHRDRSVGREERTRSQHRVEHVESHSRLTREREVRDSGEEARRKKGGRRVLVPRAAWN